MNLLQPGQFQHRPSFPVFLHFQASEGMQPYEELLQGQCILTVHIQRHHQL